MKRENPKGSAPMPSIEQDIAKNSMKFYSYLVCIAGLANYPSNTRMFRQKNLVLTQIYRTTGITDKTVKLYLYYLEYNKKVLYQGDTNFSWLPIMRYENYEQLKETEGISKSELRKEMEKEAARVWKIRNSKEKMGVYLIPRPDKWTPVPETTLDTLNEFYEVSELEMKLYLLCCCYRDQVCGNDSEEECKNRYKDLKFELVRDALNLQMHSVTDQKIRRALMFLKTIGLIDYEEHFITNMKKAKIPCFKLTQVYYYINYEVKEIDEKDVEIDIDLGAVLDRIKECLESNSSS